MTDSLSNSNYNHIILTFLIPININRIRRVGTITSPFIDVKSPTITACILIAQSHLLLCLNQISNVFIHILSHLRSSILHYFPS